MKPLDSTALRGAEISLSHRLIFSGLLLAATGATACGDDEVAPQQTVFWLGLSSTAGSQCSANENYALPEDARTTVTGSTGQGDRVKDGQDLQGTDTLVACTVKETMKGSGSFNVNLRLSVGEIGNFIATGTLGGTSGTVDVNFTTSQFNLEQDDCTANIETITGGAIWLQDLHCANMRDPRTPGIACDGLGGVIFENCTH
jgi:hypothetical protein